VLAHCDRTAGNSVSLRRAACKLSLEGATLWPFRVPDSGGIEAISLACSAIFFQPLNR
jgi:hypothetical protein